MASAADIGIDLGTSNVLIYARGKGIVLNEPAVVALERDTRSIRAIGTEAHRMIGRTPSSIAALRPLREGMVSDFELTSSMLHYFVTQVIGKRMFARPRAVLSLPSGVNEMEKRSISAIMFEAGARRTQLLDRPVAAAIGAGINITPIAFLVIANGDVKLLQLVSKPDSTDRLVNLVPDLVDKVTGLFKKDKDKEKTEGEETDAQPED